MDNIDGLLPVNCIFVEDGYDEAMKVIRSTAHTRYPLCVEDKGHIDIEDSDSDTIGGYVFGLLERTPIVGDTVEAYGYSFEVIQMQGYRISRVRVVPVPV